MNITIITTAFKCKECNEAFVKGYKVLGHSFCSDCIIVLQTSIANTLHNERQTEMKKNNAIMVPLLEEVLEDAKNMTQKEYEKFLAKCPPLDNEWQGYDAGDWDDD